MLLLFFFALAKAVVLTNVYGDDMVFQHGVPPCFNGYSEPGEVITLNMLDRQVSTTVYENGFFQICLDVPMPFGGWPGYTAIISGGELDVILTGLLGGDVYVCSGQSNMQQTVSNSFNPADEIEDSDYPNLRVITVELNYADTPQNNTRVNQPWSISSPTSIGGPDWVYFSGVCFFFGRKLAQRLGPSYPIGMIASAYGGTIIEAWMSPEALAQCGFNSPIVISPFDAETIGNPNVRSVLWNQMIHPLLSFSITGILWYQGESNVGSPIYNCNQGAMVNDWRRRFRSSSDAAFFFTQLSGYYPGTSWPDFRYYHQEASIPFIQPGMMVTATDLGDPTSPYDPIHPREKRTIGERMELAAAALIYDFPVAYEPPRVVSVNFTADFTVAIAFSEDVELRETLQCSECCQSGAVIEGEFNFQWRVMEVVSVVGNIVTAFSDSQPSEIRYAWFAYPQCMLFSVTTGLPVSPFIDVVAK